jgi:ribosomal protein S6
MENSPEMRTYECAIIFKEEGDALTVKRAFEKLNASFMGESAIVKTALSYPVRKRTYGYLGTFLVSLLPETVTQVEHILGSDPGVLRGMIRRVGKETKEKIEARIMSEKQNEERRYRPDPRAREEKKPFGEVLTNEAIEKKIEEILQ